jgi:hypothetical protein
MPAGDLLLGEVIPDDRQAMGFSGDDLFVPATVGHSVIVGMYIAGTDIRGSPGGFQEHPAQPLMARRDTSILALARALVVPRTPCGPR